MAEQTKILSLNCPNCGGVLEIHGDMDRFACGYCGSAQIVERRGGTVALRLVVDAVARVQVGTDKTAAELALVRLEKEMASLNAQWQAASVIFDQLNSSGSPLVGLGILLALVVALATLLIFFLYTLVTFSLPQSISPAYWFWLVVSIVLFGGAVVALVFLISQNAEAHKRYAAKRTELWVPYAQRIQELEKLIKKNREMVGGS